MTAVEVNGQVYGQTEERRRWFAGLPRIVGIVDAVAIVAAMLAAQLGRFGTQLDAELVGSSIDPNYWVISIVIGVAWWISIGSAGSRDIRVVGTGVTEYKSVTVSTFYLFGGVAIVSYALHVSTARGYVGIALPTGILFLVLSRWILSRWVRRNRTRGRLRRNVLLLGSPSAVEHLHDRLESTPEAGYRPSVAILPGFSMTSPNGRELPVPVVSVATEVEEIIRSIDEHDVDVVAISAGSNIKPRKIRELGWELHARSISMILAPALTDIAGPRIHTQPIAGLPLIHVSTPKLVGIQTAMKRTFDLIGATFALSVLSPLFLITAIAIKSDSSGPVFYRQERVGIRGNVFHMFKFRSMVTNADELLSELTPDSTGNGVLFKMKTDPRVTKVGRFIRRYSIDELPQLWNVIRGEMSMVGPRPPLKSEVDQYERYVERRLLVMPGITGLWQVSGRSDLEWEESVRLDLYYVENWSLTQDLTILARTIKAVFTSSGAY
ncbi:sugar transferase [Glutamicibacter nicotianae]